MRRVSHAALTAALLAACAAVPGEAATARLTLRTTTPLAVHGSGFHRHERVRVVVRYGATYTHRVRATSSGRFTTAFGRINVDRCSGFLMMATGRRGSRATLRRPPLPACAP
jgi:hypothetical protein